MPTWTDMPFGVEGPFDTVALTYGYGELPIIYGLIERSYYLQRTFTLSTSQQTPNAAGIEQDAGGLGNSGKIVSVSVTAEENMPDPVFEPRDPEADLNNESGYLLQALATSALILGTRYSYTIAGQGVPPIPESDQGEVLGVKTFNCAAGTYSIATHADTIIKQLTQNKNQNAPHDWSLECGCVVAAASPGSAHVLSPSSDWTDLIPADMIGRYTCTETMSDAHDAHPTAEWSGEFWPTA